MELFCLKPLKTDNVSPAALFRSVEKWRPTLLIDEVDAFLKANEDARGILNSGHKRNGFVLRVVGDTNEPQRFSTWGAKALCGIGSIAQTLQSRSIRLELRRKLPEEQVENLRHASEQEVQLIASKLARFSMDNSEAVRMARPKAPDCLHNREQDNWEPLLAIADVLGDSWPARARVAARAISESEDKYSQDDRVALLADILEVFQQKNVDRLHSYELLDALCADDEAPWATWNRGNPITARQLAAKLRHL